MANDIVPAATARPRRAGPGGRRRSASAQPRGRASRRPRDRAPSSRPPSPRRRAARRSNGQRGRRLRVRELAVGEHATQETDRRTRRSTRRSGARPTRSMPTFMGATPVRTLDRSVPTRRPHSAKCGDASSGFFAVHRACGLEDERLRAGRESRRRPRPACAHAVVGEPAQVAGHQLRRRAELAAPSRMPHAW